MICRKEKIFSVLCSTMRHKLELAEICMRQWNKETELKKKVADFVSQLNCNLHFQQPNQYDHIDIIIIITSIICPLLNCLSDINKNFTAEKKPIFLEG